MAGGGGLSYGPPMSTAKRPTLFASLRRDRFLFALVGTLVLFLNALQPLAASQMPEGGHMALCTALNVEGQAEAADRSSHGVLDDCPICLIGNACANAAAYKATAAAAPAFPAPASLTGAPAQAAHRSDAVERLDAPPPAIRAPPLSA